ncbi:TIGR00730 family Rossman fold protein [Croceivirga thetidis]|uniref:LOG family protein n=1 Tax=Croceivirga thetidis TaxID=2721623 RepID=UPI001FF0B69E|nr:TIGR00730 family Rossman fold protein [Croceivirga thetidis]
MKSIAVFCGSSPGKDEEIIEAVRYTGAHLAENNIKLVYGGGKVGLMGILAQGALEHKGKVIGIIPNFLKAKEVHHTGLTELILVDTMHDRKLQMHNLSDGVLMLPGGFGTFEEFFEMLTWGQLGLHQKPMGILNTNGFYNPLIKMMDKMVENRFLSNENRFMVLIDDDIKRLLTKMNNYEGHGVPKWMDKDQT